MEADVIRKAFARTGVRSDLAISETTGFNYDRLHKRRLKPGRIGAMTIGELRLLHRHAGFSDEELLEIVKGSKAIDKPPNV